MAQPASKVSTDRWKWAHLEPFLPTLEALLATWGVPLRIFMHFYEVFVNNCANSRKSQKNQANCIKIYEYCTKRQKRSLKVSRNALREAKNGTAGVNSEPGWIKMYPSGATFAHFGDTFGHLERSFTQFYAFLWGFREQLCKFTEIPENQANCIKIY